MASTLAVVPRGTSSGPRSSGAGPLRPPPHLSAAARRWWREVVSTWELETHHLKVLTAVCEAWDRMNEARAAVKRHGLLIPDRFGQLRTNPAVQIERDSRTALYRGVRELDLDLEPPRELPRVRGRR